MIVSVVDKVVVITGSSKGIGRALATAFAKERAKVIINYLNSEDSAKQLYNEIIAYNSNCLLVKSDVTQQRDVNKLYNDTINTFGKVDVLINNAGICNDNPIQLMTEEQWTKVINVNLLGPYLCSRTFSKTMIQQKSGKIINIASLKGQDGCAGQVNYSASKSGLIGFTKALAKELGKFNISVNAVCPGFIVTDLNRHNEDKKKIAESKSLLSLDTALNDLLSFLVYMTSDMFMGISGRIFNVDSRIL